MPSKKERSKAKRALKEEKNINRGLDEKTRRFIINDAVTKALEIDINFTPEIWSIFNRYIETGSEEIHTIPMPEIGRELIIKLYATNDKKSYINLHRSDNLAGANMLKVNQFNKNVDDAKQRGLDI
jgi:hypothetical protein